MLARCCQIIAQITLIVVCTLQVKFILAVVSGELVVSNRKRRDIETDLQRMGFDRMIKTEASGKRGIASAAEADGTGEEAAEDAAEGTSYLYLLSMAISSLTYEKVCTGWRWDELYRCCGVALLLHYRAASSFLWHVHR